MKEDDTEKLNGWEEDLANMNKERETRGLWNSRC